MATAVYVFWTCVVKPQETTRQGNFSACLQGGALSSWELHHMNTRCWPGVNLTHNSSNTQQKRIKTSSASTTTSSSSYNNKSLSIDQFFFLLSTHNPSSFMSWAYSETRHCGFLNGFLNEDHSHSHSFISKRGTRKQNILMIPWICPLQTSHFTKS